MPTLPTLEHFPVDRRPLPSDSGSIVPIRTGIAEEATAQAGANIAQAGSNLQVMVDRETDRMDTIRAEDAFNKLQDKKLDLTMGEQNGFVNIKGENAVKQPLFQQYTTKFTDASKEIEATLSTDKQKEKFRARAGVASIGFKGDLLRHVISENGAYAKEVFQGTVFTETRNASAQWQDPNAVASSLQRVTAAVDAMSKQEGWSPEFKKEQQLKAETGIHTAVIGQALGTKNFVFAEDYFNEHKASIDPVTAKAVQVQVEDGKQKQLYQGYLTEGNAWRDNKDELIALMSRVEKDPKLDETRQNLLLNILNPRIDRLQAKELQDSNRKNTELDKDIKGIYDLSLKGGTITDEILTDTTARVKGSLYEPEWRNFVAGLVDQQKFVGLAPTAQMGQINEDLSERSRNRGSLKDKQDLERRLESRVKIYNTGIKELSENPLAWNARRTGTDIPPLNFDDNSITERANVTSTVNKSHGGALGVFQPQEALALQQELRKKPWEERVKMLNGLLTKTKDYPGVYEASVAQLAPGSAVTAFAGKLYGQANVEKPGRFAWNDSTTLRASDLATSILRGEDMMRPPMGSAEDAKGPKFKLKEGADGFEGQFSRLTKTVFPDSDSDPAYKQYYELVKARYIDLAHNSGDRSGEVHSSMLAQAFKDVTGGGPVTFGSSRIIPEFGMKEEAFKGLINDAFGRAVAAGQTQYPPDYIKKATLLDRGGGKYWVMNGTTPLPDEKNPGNKLVIDTNVNKVNKPPPQITLEPGGGASQARVPKSWEALAQKPSAYDPMFESAAKANGVDAADLKRLSITESTLNPAAHNKQDANGGSYGLMQVNGQHLTGLGLTKEQIMDPQTNIDVAAKIWKSALDRAGGDKAKAVELYKGATTDQGKASIAHMTQFIAPTNVPTKKIRR